MKFKPHLIVLLLMLAASSHALEGWPDRIDDSGTTLTLAGRGSARYLIWRIYDAALYLPSGTGPDAVLEERTPRCLELRYRREIQASDIRRAADTVLQRQLDTTTLARLRGAIDALHKAYQDVGAGDRYRLCHAPGTPLRLYFNERLVASVSAPGVARAYFAIWLGEQAPISNALRHSLLAWREGP